MATKIQAAQKTTATDWSLPTLMALMRKRRFFTVAAFSWVVIALLTIGVLLPQVRSILTTLRTLNTLEAELEQKRNYVTSLEQLNAAEIETQNVTLTAALPLEKPVLPVLYSVDRLAADAAVSASNFQISPGLLGTQSAIIDTSAVGTSPISPDLAALPLQMDVSGSFENLSTFFKSLDKVVPFIQINTIEFASQKREQTVATTAAQYTAKVELATLYLKQRPARTSPATVITPPSAEDALIIGSLAQALAQRQADSQFGTLNTGSPSGRFDLFTGQ